MRFSPIILVLAFVFGSCSTPQNEAVTHTSSKPKVLCTTSIMADWLTHISGDAFEVTALLDKGIDPHTYKPSKRDLDAIRAADVIVYHGVHLEGKIIDVLEKIEDKLIIDAAAHVPDSIIISDPNFPASKDPHYWFDTELVQFIVGDLAQQLIAAYPETADEVMSASVSYQQEILAAADSVQKIIETIPP